MILPSRGRTTFDHAAAPAFGKAIDWRWTSPCETAVGAAAVGVSRAATCCPPSALNTLSAMPLQPISREAQASCAPCSPLRPRLCSRGSRCAAVRDSRAPGAMDSGEPSDGRSAFAGAPRTDFRQGSWAGAVRTCAAWRASSAKGPLGHQAGNARARAREPLRTIAPERTAASGSTCPR